MNRATIRLALSSFAFFQTFLLSTLAENLVERAAASTPIIIQKGIYQFGNDRGYYYKHEIGTPPQTVLLELATETSDTWMLDINGTTCTDATSTTLNCVNSGGSFDPGQSSTYKNVSGLFNITFSGEVAQGSYFNDKLSFGNVTVQSPTFGLAEYTTVGYQGYLGLGHYYATYLGDDYSPSIPYQLFQQNITSAPTVSLWVDRSGDNGTLIYGGIDLSKFTPPLFVVPVQRIDMQYAAPTTYDISINTITVTSSANQSNVFVTSDKLFRIDLSFDTSNLPSSVMASIGILTNKTIGDNGTWYADCNLAQSTDTTAEITLSLGNDSSSSISIALSELVDPFYPTTIGDSQLCPLTVQVCNHVPCRLGISFLRSAYIVLDVKNPYLYMARALAGVREENIVDITKVIDVGNGVVLASSQASPTSVPTTSTTHTIVGSSNGTGVGSPQISSSQMMGPATSTVSTATSNIVIFSTGASSSTSAPAQTTMTSRGNHLRVHWILFYVIGLVMIATILL